MRRTPLKRGTTGLKRTTGLKSSSGLQRQAAPLKRSRLAPVSKSRQAENDGPWAGCKRVVDERDGGVCQISRFFPEHVCQGSARHPHHVVPVGCGGARCDPANVATVCAPGHDWIHNNDLGGWRVFAEKWEPLCH